MNIVPNAYMIGAQKAGTTSVYAMLSRHPDIYAPEYLKEIQFFTDPRLYELGEAAYRRLFSLYRGQKVAMAGDTNAAMFTYAAKRLCTYNAASRIIFLVRDPVDRAVSAYHYACQRGLETRTIDEAFSAELDRTCTYDSFFRNVQHSYLQHGMYFEQLRHYLDVFPKNQVYVGVFEEFISNTAECMNNLTTFLGVRNDIAVPLARKKRTLGGYRSKRVNHWLFGEGDHRRLLTQRFFKLLPPAPALKILCEVHTFLTVANAKFAARAAMSAGVRDRLRSHFREDTAGLADYLKRDLRGLWQL